jgi:hypothetical protein
MSHFTVENIIRRVATFHNTTFRLLNTHSGMHTIALRTWMRFIHHNPLPFFLQIMSISIRENTFSPKWAVSTVGTQFIASTNLLKSLLACITCIVPLNKLVDAINWVPTVVMRVQKRIYSQCVGVNGGQHTPLRQEA